MTLHDAIQQVIRQHGRPMSTKEIAEVLNKNKFYQKKDLSPITPFQIHGRTRNKSSLFKQDGSMISLVGVALNKKPAKSTTTASIPLKLIQANESKPLEASLAEKVLMNEKNYKKASAIDDIVPDRPGLYCIRILNSSKLPSPFNDLLIERGHNIIYIGIATQSLRKRFLGQELRARGHGTFFRSIGAVLGFRPLKGSLLNKANKRNYTFSATDEQKIITWINANLIVNWIESNADFENFETNLICKYRPLINLAKNPHSLIEVSAVRAQCVSIANMV